MADIYNWWAASYCGAPGVASFVNYAGVFVWDTPVRSVQLTGENIGAPTPYDGWYSYFVNGHYSGLAPTKDAAMQQAISGAQNADRRGSDSKHRSIRAWREYTTPSA